MGRRVVFFATFTFMGVVVLGCGASAMRELPVGAAHAGHGHAGHGDQVVQGETGDGHHHPAAGDTPQVVRYRAGDGFVPARLDVQTGTRVLLVDESGGDLAPMFGAAHSGADDPGAVAHDAASAEADHEQHEQHDQHGHAGHHGGAAPVWMREGPDGAGPWSHAFSTSGYWRFHNAKAPGHVALIVALPPEGTMLEPLVTSAEALTFPAAPELTNEQFTELLGDTGKVREYMEIYGPANTLNLLRQGEIETGIDCHSGAHHLGRMAFAEFGAAAVLGVDEVCQSGVRHGVMEQLFVSRGITNLAEDVGALCPSAEVPFIRHQCLHGVGHGVMAWTAYELEDALGLCDRLGDGDDLTKRSCYTGVFMENVVSGLSGEVGQTSTYVDDEDPHYPCNALPERYVNDCYWYQTSQMLNVFHHDLSRVPEACQEAPPNARRACFGSWGRDVGGTHRGNPYLIAQYCRLSPTLGLQGDCIDGAARTVFWDSTQQDAGIALCTEVEDPIAAETCWQTIVSQAHLVGSDLAPFCAQLPGRWLDRCLRRP